MEHHFFNILNHHWQPRFTNQFNAIRCLPAFSPSSSKVPLRRGCQVQAARDHRKARGGQGHAPGTWAPNISAEKSYVLAMFWSIGIECLNIVGMYNSV